MANQTIPLIRDAVGKMYISSQIGVDQTPGDKQLELYSTGNTALRIQNSTTGSGNGDGLLIETSIASPGNALIWQYESAAIRFGTAGTERMQITSGGQIRFGPDAEDIQIVPHSLNSGVGYVYLRGNASNDASSIILNHYGHADYYISAGRTANGKFSISNADQGDDFVMDTSGNIGIGTDTPRANLHVINTAGEAALLVSSGTSGANRSGIFIDSPGTTTVKGSMLVLGTDQSFRLGTASYYHIKMDANGNTTIFQNSTAAALTITGSSGAATFAGTISAAGDITASTSDSRFKTNKGRITNALDKVCSLTGFYYTWNDLAKSKNINLFKDDLQVGVSAQEVQKVMPEVIKPAPIDNDYLTVQYEKLVPLLIESIKELKAEVDALKAKFEDK